MPRFAQDRAENERERNNGLPCIWHVKPEVLHREHSLEADTPQLLGVHERHAELEIAPVAALQHGAADEIGGKRSVVVNFKNQSMKHTPRSSRIKPTQDPRGNPGTSTSGIGMA